MKKHLFKGVATALVTPFSKGYIDFPALSRLVEEQIFAGVDALVAVGTTGESATLSDDEKYEVIRAVVNTAAHRVPVIAGAGSNDTAHAVNLCRASKEAGADALLCVTPYYNKTSAKGIVAHYAALSDATDLPVVVYNVPSRTGVDITPQTYAELASLPNVAGIKEASGSVSKLARTVEATGGKLDVFIGNDDMILPALSLGCAGTISVLSNVAPAGTKLIHALFFEGKNEDAARLFLKYLPLADALFSDVNPVPVKAALSILGKCRADVRLPLVETDGAVLDKLRRELERVGLLNVGGRR